MSAFVAFRRRHGRIEQRFRPTEQRLLREALHDLGRRLDEAGSPSADQDAVLQRLLPATYPDDPLAELEFRAAVRDRQVETKSETVERIERDLAAAPGGVVHLDDEGAVIWLKGLGDLRLVLATRYGADAVARGHSQAALLYGWLSWLQAGLVDAMTAP